MKTRQFLYPGFRTFAHGGDYNPDQWMDRYPEVIDRDLELMDLSGCNTFSVGIFAWARYEPREGEYHFDWMRDLLDRLHAAGKHAVLATPSGSKPAWMSETYPEIRRVDERDRRDHHHGRHNHCYTSPVYREKVSQMNRRLAEEFGDHPAVVLWHLSNEYGGECYCDLCLAAFREWLQDRYKTLDNLNHAWWAHFWSHTLTDWDQIDPRDESVDGMRLDWMRFVSHQTVDFMKAETRALREGGATQPVTTNMMGTFPTLDYWRFVEDVDVIADDAYPLWKYNQDDLVTAAGAAFSHDMHRAMKGGRPWMLMESCTDTVQWCEVPKLKRPGVYRTEMIQALAHGADSLMYFQWRKGRGSQEKFHGAVVDHEGSTNTRTFQQVREIGSLLGNLEQITGWGNKPEVAVVMDWDARWAMEFSDGVSRMEKEATYMSPVFEFHRMFWKLGVSTDVIESTCDLSDYRLVVAPQLYLLKPGVADALMSFVKKGGTLLLTCFSGVVNESNLCFMGGFPGDGLREFCGVWAEEMDFLYEGEHQTIEMSAENALGLSGTFRTQRKLEVLHAEGADVLATVTSDFYAGYPIFTCKEQGEGKVFYLGAHMQETFLDALGPALIRTAGVKQVIETVLPEGVSAQKRTNGKQDFVFLQNFTTTTVTVSLDDRDYCCMETGDPVSSKVELAEWESRILIRNA